MDRPAVALVHDYLTQRGGAERVVLALLKAFPEAPLYTSLYEPATTYPEYAGVQMRTLPLNRVKAFRRDHRLAFPLLAPSFSRLQVEAPVVFCSSAGWAHGTRVHGRKVVYCHAPARWLYQPDRYLRGKGMLARGALMALRRPLRAWDHRAAASADRYLTNSTMVRDQVREIYRIDAEVLPPPVSVDASGAQHPVPGIEPGFVLNVSRPLPYKNVDAVVQAFEGLPGERLVVVGSGPDLPQLRRLAGPNVRLLGGVSEEALRWLYASCAGIVAAAYEDFGLTPLEGAAFGKPTAALRLGGFLDTIVEGETGLLFDRHEPDLIRRGVRDLLHHNWDETTLRAHAASFSETAFIARLREVAGEEAALAREGGRGD